MTAPGEGENTTELRQPEDGEAQHGHEEGGEGEEEEIDEEEEEEEEEE